MKYFKIKDNYLVKYNIIIEEDKLIKIKEELIEKCSIKSNINYITDNPPFIKNLLDYQEKCLDENKYEISYTQIFNDTLVYVIDGLLKGMVENLDYLFHPVKKDTSRKQMIIDSINDINNYISSLNDNTKVLLHYNNRLRELKNELSLIEERNQKHNLALLYIPEILTYIHFEEIKKYPLLDIKNYVEFLEIDNFDIKTLNRKKEK